MQCLPIARKAYYSNFCIYCRCKKCKRTWHSINGLVEFKYRLSRKETLRGERDYGSVKLILNGQKCKGSACQKEFSKPVFQSDSIQYVLQKLLVKVKQKFYDCNSDDLAKKFADLQGNYQPAGRGSHIPDLCEGCQKGLCNSKATANGDQRPTLYRQPSGAYSAAGDIYVKWEIEM